MIKMIVKNIVCCTFKKPCINYFLQHLKTTLQTQLRCINSYSTEAEEVKDCPIPVENIRNFSIIAHVDHGKSTLADRILEMTGAIQSNSGMQVLDKLQVEKERGITVKAQTASLNYSYNDTKYLLNLIDTPGHVDFSTEVYRSLAACQGVILLVDANDGVQAQTVANFYLAFGSNLTIIPAINKIDLKNANPERVSMEMNALFDFPPEEITKISAKHGTNVDELLKRVVMEIPPPAVDRDKPLKALIFDSWYDKYKGAVALVYIKDGFVKVGQMIASAFSGKIYEVKSLALLRPDEQAVKQLYAGQVGCIACNMKTVAEAHIGDTLHLKDCAVEPISGFKNAKSMVFAGIYPMDQSQYNDLSNAISKLVLNDSAVNFMKESSPALGQGFRIGFLGMLHMEVFCERLEQEYGALPVLTSPGVTYKAVLKKTKKAIKNQKLEIFFNNPAEFPDKQSVDHFLEPIVLGTIITPVDKMGAVYNLCLEKRGIEKSSKDIDKERMILQFILPLNEVIIDFHDTLKSISSGYASFDYENYGFQPSEIVKLSILLNGINVEELSTIVHVSKAKYMGKQMCEKLLNIIPRQQFEIAIQATVGSHIISRENLKSYRKDVTAKLYGGDVTRKMKLLARQREGKKQMKMVGKIALPRETFIDILKR